MNWLEFTSVMTGHLAWPGAAIVIGLLFKERVRELLAKMKTFKGPGGLEASFSDEVKRAADEIKDIRIEISRLPVVKTASVEPQSFSPRLQTPRDRMLFSWEHLEEAVMEYAEATGVGVGKSSSSNFDNVLISLLYQNKLPTKTLGLLQELKDLRDDLIDNNLEPSRADSVYFMGTAHALTDYVHALKNELEAS